MRNITEKDFFQVEVSRRELEMIRAALGPLNKQDMSNLLSYEGYNSLQPSDETILYNLYREIGKTLRENV